MKKYAFLSLLAVLALGACDDDDDPTGNTQTAQVRVVNATTATTGTNNFTSVSLFRGATGTNQVVGGVPAGVNTSTVNASACSPTLTVPSGSQTLRFRATGGSTDAASVTHNFVAGRRYVVVLTGNNNTGLAARVFEETAANATSGNRRIRFINASSTAGDIFATPTTTGTPTGTPTAVAAGAASDFVSVANANTGFRIFNTGTTTTARQSLTLNTTNFPASGNAMVIFTEAGAFQVNACS